MAAQNKKPTSSTTSAAAAPAPAAPAVAAPIETTLAAPAVAAVAVAAVEAPPPVDDVNTRIAATVEKAQSMIAIVKDLLTELKSIQKDVAKRLKSQQGRRRKAAGTAAVPGSDGEAPTRKPSGFAKPTAVSKELCDFLGKPVGCELARTDVTRLLNKYIKDNNLQDPVDRRTIRPDEKLQALLAIKGDTQLKYFNMQSYIKHHFIKAEAPAVATA
jgi:chromatin remodeling complex protein RSC6